MAKKHAKLPSIQRVKGFVHEAAVFLNDETFYLYLIYLFIMAPDKALFFNITFPISFSAKTYIVFSH